MASRRGMGRQYGTVEAGWQKGAGYIQNMYYWQKETLNRLAPPLKNKF